MIEQDREFRCFKSSSNYLSYLKYPGMEDFGIGKNRMGKLSKLPDSKMSESLEKEL